MEIESTELSFLLIFTLISFFITFFAQKYFSNKKNILLDVDFFKPQAFHTTAIARCGGLAAIFSLSVFFIMNYLFFEKILLDYILVSFSLFFVGFLDDIKTQLSPNIRLFLMIILLLFCIAFLNIKLASIDLKFLNTMLIPYQDNKIFHIFFVLLCFLFIINGANLIDGFNGLLGIHLLIINIILLYMNLENKDNEFLLILTIQIIILFCFLIFNFPKALIFLGDGGSYLFGSLTVLNVIKTNNLNPEISSFFFCILLFYLFFEVFFSFFRKIYLKKSPLKPDKNHLHMLSYRWLGGKAKFNNCNYLNSLAINFVYLLRVIPGLYYSNNGIFCRYWFFSLLAFYLIFYSRLYSFVKK